MTPDPYYDLHLPHCSLFLEAQHARNLGMLTEEEIAALETSAKALAGVLAEAMKTYHHTHHHEISTLVQLCALKGLLLACESSLQETLLQLAQQNERTPDDPPSAP